MLSRFLIIIAFFVLGLASARADITLPSKVVTVPIGGQNVNISIASRASFDGSVLGLHVTAGLADFQVKVPAILAHFAEQQTSCEWRWSFPRLDPVIAADGYLALSGDIRVEAWLCAGSLETRLGQETASFAFRVSARVENNAAKLVPELISLDLGNSLLKDVGADGIVRDFVEKAVRDLASGDKLTFGFPEDVRDLNPVLDSIAIGNEGDPSRGTIIVTAHVPGSLDLLRKIWELLGGN